MILVFILIPITGLFSIDLVAGNFVVLGRQIWWSDYSIMLGFVVMLATLGILTYSTIGTVWCGWACPQNTVSEWANNLTHKFLGKHADVNVESEGLKVAAAKNRIVNWIILAASFLAVSLIMGLIPFFYFFTPDVIWSFVTFKLDSQLATFMHRLYFVSVVATFLDIAAIRYFWCNYACLYRFGQRFFRNKEAMHVGYDATRSSDCAKCNFCSSSCILDLNPTSFEATDTCINCGECIDACNKLHEKRGTGIGLLKYRAGIKHDAASRSGTKGSLFMRYVWVGAIFLLGSSLFVWGLISYSPYDIVAYRSEKSTGISVSDYRIQISNKLYAPTKMSLSVKGLPDGSYKLDAEEIEMEPASRTDVNLHVDPNLPRGLHRIIIEARSQDGWVGRFGVEHFSARN